MARLYSPLACIGHSGYLEDFERIPSRPKLGVVPAMKPSSHAITCARSVTVPINTTAATDYHQLEQRMDACGADIGGAHTDS